MSIRRTLVKPSKTLQISLLDLSLTHHALALLLQGYPVDRHTLYNASPKDQSFAQIDQTRVMSGKGIHSWKEECTM